MKKVFVFVICVCFVLQSFNCIAFGSGGAAEENADERKNLKYYYTGAYNYTPKELQQKAVSYTYPVYIDGEATEMTVRGHKYNSDNIEDDLCLKDLLEIYGGKLTMSPRNYNESNGQYILGNISIDDEEYIIECVWSIKDIQKIPYFCSNMDLVNADKSSTQYNGGFLILKSGYSSSVEFRFIDNEFYVPITAAYYLLQKHWQMFNLDDDCFNIKNFDQLEEERKIGELFKFGEPGSNYENYTYEVKPFDLAFVNAKWSIDASITNGHSIPLKEAKKYGSLLFQGAMGYIVNYDLYVDYNEGLDSYIVYNKPYDGLTKDEIFKTVDLIIFRAYDGKLIYKSFPSNRTSLW